MAAARSGIVEMVDESTARGLATNSIDVDAHSGSTTTDREMWVALEMRAFIDRGDAPLER
jgi:hypothetical protein